MLNNLKKDDNSPLISVIITTHNRKHIVIETIESVLGQTFKDYEIIVVDDGSTDGTEEILKSYQGRIRYFYKDRGGVGSSKNYAIKMARGTYVAFLDSDDLWLPNKLEKQVEVITQDPSNVFISTDCFRMIKGEELMPGNRPGHSGWVFEKLLHRNFVIVSSVLARRDILVECGLFDETLPRAQDLEFWLRISRRYPFYYINEQLTIYRSHGDQLTVKRLRGHWDSWLEIFTRLFKDKNNYKISQRRIIVSQLAKAYYKIGKIESNRKNFKQSKYYFRTALKHRPLNLKYWMRSLQGRFREFKTKILDLSKS